MNCEKMWRHLTVETKRFFDEAGIEQAVLGVSGGVDSALVYMICREALGAGNVVGIVMPSRFSSDETQADAVKILEAGGSEARVIPIGNAVEVFEQMTELEGTAHENVQARIRMVILMGVANQENRLLMSTGNLSEDMVGYFTLYGDSAGALSPIGDLYKTEVFELAGWVNENVLPLPEGVLSRPPSAELSEGQKDSDLLPTYSDLDRALKHLAGKGKPHPDQGIAERVTQMVVGSAFKREQICPAIPVRHLI